MKRGIGALGLAAALIMVALGACTDGAGKPHTGSAEQYYEIAPPIGTLAVEARAAKVNLSTGDGPVAVKEILRYSRGKPATDHVVDEGTLRLTETGCGGGGNLRCEVEYQIRVPAQTATRIITHAGDVSVRGVGGAVVITTDAGRVHGDALTSDDVNVATRAGQVRLGFTEAPALVQTQTDIGAIDVRVPGGQPYAVDVSADAGTSAVSVDREAGAAHRITARTRAGAVTIAKS